MSNFDTARDALEVSLNSSGSAMEEHAKWSQSLEAQLLKLQAAWQSLSQSFMNSNFLKGALDAVIGFVDAINWLIDTFGTLPTLIGAFAAFESIQGVGFFNTIKDEATGAVTGVTNALSKIKAAINNANNNVTFSFGSDFTESLANDKASLQMYELALNSGMSAQEAFNATMQSASPAAQQYAKTVDITGESIKKFTDQQKMSELSMKAQDKSWANCSTLINSYNKSMESCGLSQEQFLQSVQKSNPALYKYLSGLGDADATFKGYVKSLISAKISTFALEAATMALNMALTMGISALISFAVKALDKMIVTSEELAEKVEEVTSKYKEQHEELTKLQGDYDTSNESSMISKYEKLSKGVDNLGRNVSLTADEYSEYQSIVNNIAEQIPSLVSGYDEQGNAMLSCKGNVEELVAAYEKLIHLQNQEILTNTGDIEKDFANTVKDADGETLWGKFREWNTNLPQWAKTLINMRPMGAMINSIDPVADLAGNKMTTDTADALKDLLNADRDEISDIIVSYDDQTLQEIETALKDADVDVGFFGGKTAEALEETLKNEPAKIKGIVDDFYGELEETIEQQKLIAAAKLSEAFDISSSLSGLNYNNISEELQSIAYQTINSLDYDFFTNLKEHGKTIEQWTTEMLDSLNSLSSEENKKIETGFELQTKFNGGDISYGQYIGQLRETANFVESLDVPDEVKNQIKLSLNSEDILADYNALVHDLGEIGLDDSTISNFLNSLSAEEYSVAMKIIPDLDAGTTISEIQSLIDEQLATEFTFNIEIEITGIEALNTALSEARSATGLTSESISLLKSRYEDLEGFNAASLFEETALGVRLNNEELARLESQYETVNKLDIDKNLNTLIAKYQNLTEEIKNCTDEQEKENLQLQADAYADKIEELQTLSSQYDGLTSAFNKWQTALSSSNNGDNYDAVFDNFETVKELYEGGLVGTDDFKTFAQLMSDEDLSSASVDEYVSAYRNGISVMKKYFTEGQDGCKKFLNDISELNSEWAHLNEDGKWEIDFNAEDVAKELGISADAVLLIADKLKDYGFEVKIDDTSLEDLQTDIEKNEAKLKELGQTPYPVDLTIEANAENIETIESEIEKLKTHINEVNNNGSINIETKTALLDDARAKLEALIDKKQEASQPAFMNLDTSQVNASLVDALEKVQSYQNAINELNKLNELKEAGITIDDSQLQTAKQKVDECAEAIQGLDGEVKVAIGLEEDGSVDSIKKAFEEGKVEIDANTDPALTKIELLAENVERIEDKDVTINVTVNGLEDVKELNRNIDLATNIDGDIDSLSEYVENAKALSELDSNITTYVTANVKGNVLNTPEFKINNLETFAKGAKDLEGIGSFTTNVEANVKGNVTETKEYKINNLKTFSDSAKDVDSIGDVSSSVTADIKGNVVDKFEYQIDNLKVFSDNAKDLNSVGNVESNVKANIEGNVVNKFEEQIDNLKVFKDNAEGLSDIGNVEVSATANVYGNVTSKFEEQIDNLEVFADNANSLKDVGNVESEATANVYGNVTGKFEEQIDNLKVFAENAESLKTVGNIESEVTANIKGNVDNKFEEQIDNLKVYSDSAKDLKDIGDVESEATANVYGNVVGKFEEQIDNLKVFSDSAKDIDSIGTVNSKVTADIEGNVIDTSESKINGLKTYSDSAQKIDGIGDISSSVTADVEGNVIDTAECKIDNLKEYYDSAKDVSKIGKVTSKVTADINGNVIDTEEYKIDNLKEYSDSAKNVESIGDVTSKVAANIEGNVTETAEYKIDNLKEYSDSAKNVKDIGEVTSSVTADVNGNVINKLEEQIDNLKVYGDSAKSVKGIGTVDSSVAADVSGNVLKTSEEKIDNLGVFADNAKKVKGVGNFSSSVSANVNGNITTDDTAVTDLEHFASVVSGMQNQTIAVTVTANVDSANINSAISLLKGVSESGVFKNYSATVQVGAKIATIDDTTIQNYKAPEKDGKVVYTVDSSAVDTWTAPPKTGTVNYSAEVEALTDSQKHKTGTITYTAHISGFPVVNGTANINGTAFANGTSGKAFKHGDWGAKRTETALTGELGRELVVYKNRYWTVGDNGAEFATIPRGAIVFNHRQTEELFKNGRVTSDGGRGRALVEGTAYNNVAGEGQFYNPVTGQTYGSSSNSSSDKDSSEVIDWIETIIDRVERAIDKFDQQANNIYKSWTSRNTALQNQISEVSKEISLQQKAYNKYMSAAEGVGLSSSYAEKVRNGTIDIETIKDESLKEKIDDYQNWLEKALDCQQAIEELKETEASLYQQRFENVSAQYEGILGTIEHEKNMLEEYINQSETQGWLVSYEYYRALSSNEKRNIAELEKQKANMLKELQDAMESGTIEKGSETWYEMVNAIDEVSFSLEEANTRVMEISQTAQQLKWEQFDLLQDKISSITEETEFLIELMSSDKLFDDKGQLTDSGMATMGQHGVAYNTHMQQADQAREEAERLQREKARNLYNGTDKYDEDLEERYRELIALQQEHILAAQGEKEAIRDMVEEGINLELDALQERIDKYNEALDSQKDLYDYQKKVKEQTEEIASLEKQMAAYSGDDSEEARQRVQQLKVDLESAREELQESEYDKYISDQQQLLDELYLEYEEVLNTRLDNIDALLSDMIVEINSNATTIGSTLSDKADSVGYVLSDSIKTIWDSNTVTTNNVITTYGEKFSTAQTTTNNALNAINTNLQNMIGQLNTMAKTNVKSASISSASNSSQANASAIKSNALTSSNKKPSSQSPARSYPYGKASETTGNIGIGANGNQVRAIQYALNQLGYGNSGTKSIDGIFGSGTRSAVKSFQSAMGITADGIVGNITRAKFKAKNYAFGKKNFLDDEIAWTQDGGREFIVRPSDGAILTPIAKGDSVLTSVASGNIWDMANSPAEFIKDNLNLGSASVPSNSTVQNTVTQHFENITFSMPNVHGYNDLIKEMQRDPKFEKLILSMTIDRIAGKSSLAKGKSIR